METSIVEIAKHIYIYEFFIWLGLSQELSVSLAIILTACISYLLIYLGKSLRLRCRIRKTSRNLEPYYDEYSVKRATKYFISTNGQNISPTKEEEPAIGNKFITRNKLIPFFINNVFQGKKESDKFYLILADSGMGKTTFLINLYIRYNSVFNFKSKNDVKMKWLPFGDERIIQTLKNITQDEAKNTILLLDAFDEYKGLLTPITPDGLTDDERFRKQLDEIFEITRDFRNVIISSRTQYFPAQEENPYELNIPRFGKNGFHKLSKLYLSPFDEKDIKKYLNKKFGIFKVWNFKKKSRAKKITGGDSHKLMVRPMLLSYIDYLVDGDISYEKTFDIYDTLIKKWIEREGIKRKHNNEIREKFKKDLLKFSKLVAIEMYKSKEYSKGIDKNTAQEICKKHNLNLEGYEITGQSLLTRDVAGNWKFAHKSIYEFFIAEKAIEDIYFGFNLDITSLDMTKKFINEEDKDSSLYFFNHILINEKNNCYISNNVVNIREYWSIIGKHHVDFKDRYKHGRVYVSRLEAISYCNKLNEIFGYNIHYDDKGILRDENNKEIDSTQIIGFRFPTINEFRLLLKEDFFDYSFGKDRIESMLSAAYKNVLTRKIHTDLYQMVIKASIEFGLIEWCSEIILWGEYDFYNSIKWKSAFFDLEFKNVFNREKILASGRFLRLVFVNNLT